MFINCRCNNLDSMPSFDSRFKDAAGDIWQHRINNPSDWEDNWIFSDRRFNLINCDDEIFLKFLSEMLHPVVCNNQEQIDRLVQFFNENLHPDGYEIFISGSISNHSVYSGRYISDGQSAVAHPSLSISPNRGPLGTHFRVTGHNFVHNENVIIHWHGKNRQ